MHVERVIAGEFYWCLSCRFCGTTLALSKALSDQVPPEALAQPLQCYSCRSRTWYTEAECRRLAARADGAPWAGVAEV